MIEIGTALKVAEIVLSVAKPILETVAPKMQEGMKAFSERMLALSEKYPSLEKFSQMISKGAEILGDVLFLMGVKADSADELGVKAAQASKGVSDFNNNVEAYISYLRDEIHVDKEKIDNMSQEEKTAYTIAGMAIEAGAIAEKMDIKIPADAVEMIAKIAEIGKVVMGTQELLSLIKDIKEAGVNNLMDVCDCIHGDGDSDRVITSKAMEDALDRQFPSKGRDLLLELQDEMRS